MNDHALHGNALNLKDAGKLVADLGPEQMTAQPAPGMNHAAWVLGHLAWAADLGPQILGEAPGFPAEWVPLFDNSSEPKADASAYPSKAELLAALEDATGRLAASLGRATPEQLAAEFPIAEFRATHPTAGDGVVFLATNHAARHLGQLSAWRRALGLPRI